MNDVVQLLVDSNITVFTSNFRVNFLWCQCANVFDAIYYSFIWAYIGANDKLRSPGEKVSTHLGKG